MLLDIRPYLQSSTGHTSGSASIYFVVPNGLQAVELTHRSGFADSCLQEKATVFIPNTNVQRLHMHHGRGYLCVALKKSCRSGQGSPVLGIFYAAHTNGQVSYLPWLGQTKPIDVTFGNLDQQQIAVPRFFDGKRDWNCIRQHFSPTLHVRPIHCKLQ